MSITPILSLPAIPAPWTIPMKRTTPLEGAVSGVQQVRAMLADRTAVPMLEKKPKDEVTEVRPAPTAAATEGTAGETSRGTTRRGIAMRLPPEGIAM